jgi:hypothetical protein
VTRWRVALLAAIAAVVFVCDASAQGVADSSRKWEIVDNSFLVEESFNQEPGVFQNIFSWMRSQDRSWQAAFTQEWPAPNLTHQFSYTVPFAGTPAASGMNDILLNYRFQWLTETDRHPAVSPRVSVIVPTGSETDGLGSGVVGLQVNVPASKQFGDLYLHANGGWTWLPSVDLTPHAAGSAIWRVMPMFNVMLESVAEFGDAFTISPGFRLGWNIGDHQLVVGAAAPLTRSDGRNTAAMLTYFSYELPFR